MGRGAPLDGRAALCAALLALCLLCTQGAEEAAAAPPPSSRLLARTTASNRATPLTSHSGLGISARTVKRSAIGRHGSTLGGSVNSIQLVQTQSLASGVRQVLVGYFWWGVASIGVVFGLMIARCITGCVCSCVAECHNGTCCDSCDCCDDNACYCWPWGSFRVMPSNSASEAGDWEQEEDDSVDCRLSQQQEEGEEEWDLKGSVSLLVPGAASPAQHNCWGAADMLRRPEVQLIRGHRSMRSMLLLGRMRSRTD